jgi:hypothetical protein
LSNPNPDPNETRSRRDALSDLQARVEAAIDEVRPKIKRALEELDAKVDAAVADIKPKAQSAMRDVQPKVDQFVADMQPRLDSLLQRLQSRIEELRRDLDARASRRPGQEAAGSAAGELMSGNTPPPDAGSTVGDMTPGTSGDEFGGNRGV